MYKSESPAVASLARYISTLSVSLENTRAGESPLSLNDVLEPDKIMFEEFEDKSEISLNVNDLKSNASVEPATLKN